MSVPKLRGRRGARGGMGGGEFRNSSSDPGLIALMVYDSWEATERRLSAKLSFGSGDSLTSVVAFSEKDFARLITTIINKR